ncbi:MAG: hypothetical protein TEF_00380 [Rhizobiales bacterium NRL2]|jgi:hypothetical protein|nr:MAG: hypothetical protein TEF_00380 [Rhizobiales bacterium NRL2]
MLSTDLQHHVDQLRDLMRSGELTEERLQYALLGFEEAIERVAELELMRAVAQPVQHALGGSTVRVCRPGEVPPPAGYREAASQQMDGFGEVASFEPDPTQPVVRLEDFRGRR